MFKLTQLLHKGRQVKELQKIQKEKEEIQKVLSTKVFPYCSSWARNTSMINIRQDLAEVISLILDGRASFESLDIFCDKNFDLSDARNFFKDLGNYFANLSGNLEIRNPLEDKLEKLCDKERKLKEKLGIK